MVCHSRGYVEMLRAVDIAFERVANYEVADDMLAPCCLSSLEALVCFDLVLLGTRNRTVFGV